MDFELDLDGVADMTSKQVTGGTDDHLEAILEAVQGILDGNLDQEVKVDAQGVVAHLAGTINKIIVNLRTAHPNLDQASKEAPALADTADTIASLMAGAAQDVLERSDQLLGVLSDLEASATGNEADKVKEAKALVFDIISSQSYQDRARQDLAKLEKKLESMRDTLLKVLLVMNLAKGDEGQAGSSRKLLKEVKNTSEAQGPLNQDLVDELLAEFGL